MAEETRDPELAALERALAALQPRSRLDRDRVMYRAGQRSLRRPFNVLAGVAIAYTVAITLAAILLLPAKPTVDRMAGKAPESPPTSPESSPPVAAEQPGPPSQTALNYYQLEDRLLRLGLDGLPPLPPARPLPKLNPLLEPDQTGI